MSIDFGTESWHGWAWRERGGRKRGRESEETEVVCVCVCVSVADMLSVLSPESVEEVIRSVSATMSLVFEFITHAKVKHKQHYAHARAAPLPLPKQLFK